MEVKALFPTPVLLDEPPDGGRLCAELAAIILGREAATTGVTNSNAGGWQSDADFAQWGGPAGAALIRRVVGLADEHTGVFNAGALHRVPINWKINAWANVNRRGDSNSLHFHPGAYWSAVFYVDDGGIDGADGLGGSIDFTDPRGAAPMMQAPQVRMLFPGCANAGQGERFYPRRNMLLMFPAWLGHYVTPYLGEKTRISIAINLTA